jgi:glucokinase
MTKRLIGVDVGGTKIAVAALEAATLRTPQIEPTDTRGGAELVDQLVAAIGRAGAASAVGVAVPSVVDFATGRVR